MLERLGVKRVINASGTLTRLGGCRVSHDAMNAMLDVAYDFVDMSELIEKSGSFVAKLVGAEDALITSGAAAGIVISVAACMTEGDIKRMAKLPDSSGMKNEVLMQSQHWNDNPYAVLATIPGAKIKLINNKDENVANALESSLTANTAAIIHTEFSPDESLPLTRVLEVAHAHGVRVIVDAAAELPPSEKLTNILGVGADAVIFSGGKDISAPNDTGVILGKRDLIRWCKLLGPLSYLSVDGQTRTFIGRPMKISKEDVIAFTAAFEKYLSINHAERIRRWDEMCGELERFLRNFSEGRIKAEKISPGIGERIRPVVVPRVKVIVADLEPESVAEMLKRHDPPIYVICREDGVYINPQCLTDDELKVLEYALLSLSNATTGRVAGDIIGLDKGGTYSHFTAAHGMVFISGLSGQNDGRDTTFAEQLDATLAKLERVLIKADSSLSNIMKLTVYLSDSVYFKQLNDTFSKRFPTKPPARTTIICSFVNPQIKVEIDAIALRSCYEKGD